ncbi:Hypothetical protein D9617_5g070060 [Elsinoe fawcettii]|nr:Hypothetical protein D9617_5g070060 [Elsinoe fawcettii]
MDQKRPSNPSNVVTKKPFIGIIVYRPRVLPKFAIFTFAFVTVDGRFVVQYYNDLNAPCEQSATDEFVLKNISAVITANNSPIRTTLHCRDPRTNGENNISLYKRLAHTTSTNVTKKLIQSARYSYLERPFYLVQRATILLGESLFSSKDTLSELRQKYWAQAILLQKERDKLKHQKRKVDDRNLRKLVVYRAQMATTLENTKKQKICYSREEDWSLRKCFVRGDIQQFAQKISFKRREAGVNNPVTWEEEVKAFGPSRLRKYTDHVQDNPGSPLRECNLA